MVAGCVARTASRSAGWIRFVGKFDFEDTKRWFGRFFLDLDARIDSTLFSSGAGAREL